MIDDETILERGGTQDDIDRIAHDVGGACSAGFDGETCDMCEPGDRLLSDEELINEVEYCVTMEYKAPQGEPAALRIDRLMRMFNTQKRLYAESVIGEEPKPFINGEYPAHGKTVTIDLENNLEESLKFVQDNGKYILWVEQRARIK